MAAAVFGKFCNNQFFTFFAPLKFVHGSDFNGEDSAALIPRDYCERNFVLETKKSKLTSSKLILKLLEAKMSLFRNALDLTFEFKLISWTIWNC